MRSRRFGTAPARVARVSGEGKDKNKNKKELLSIPGVILNLGRARKYQREIDALDAAEKQN